MAHAGRPRKAGARKPSGGLRFVVDEGSPMLLAHRALAIDPTLARFDLQDITARALCKDKRTAYPLGILFMRREISSSQHYAGRRWMGLYVRAVRGVGTPCVLGGVVASGNATLAKVFDEEMTQKEAHTRAAYLEARRALHRAGRPVEQLVDAVAVFDIAPQLSAMPMLRTGLDTLHRHFERMDEVMGR